MLAVGSNIQLQRRLQRSPADTRLGLYVAPIWFVLLGVAWFFNRQTPLQQARILEWKAEAAIERAALAQRRTGEGGKVIIDWSQE